MSFEMKKTVYGNCSINLHLTHKILVTFYNLKNYDSHHIVQGSGEFGLKINVKLSGLEKYGQLVR